MSAEFLLAMLPGRLQHSQQLSGLGAVGGWIVPGHTSAFNQGRGAVQGGVCRFYVNQLLAKAHRPCYNEER